MMWVNTVTINRNENLNSYLLYVVRIKGNMTSDIRRRPR